MDQEKIKQGTKLILEGIGEDLNREGLLNTPDRVARMYREICSGYEQDPKKILGTVFEKETYNQMVISRDIELYSLCEHHVVPFFGKCHIAYIPDKKVVGLSKLARLVDVYAKRLQIQERMTEQISIALMEYLQPQGCGVMIEAAHLCTRMRGVEKQNSIMITSSLKGNFLTDQKVKEEFFTLIKKGI